MKKLIYLILLCLYTTVSVAKDNYVGSLYFRPIVGGLYEKNGTFGMVFYVDENTRTMKILCVTPDEIIREDESSTYTAIKRRYNTYGWNLLDTVTCDIITANMNTILNNRAWVDNMEVYIPRYCDIAMESPKNCRMVNLYDMTNPYTPYNNFWRYESEITTTGTYLHEFEFAHTGWRNVPLEPQYVTHWKQ